MGLRGFQKQSEATARKKGTYRKDRYKSPERIEGFIYLESIPEPPSLLNEHGVNYWNTTLNGLLESGALIATVDLYLFTDLCYLWQSMAECTEKINEHGYTITDHKGIEKVSPYYKTYIRLNKSFISLSKMFGLTPVSRSILNGTQSF